METLLAMHMGNELLSPPVAFATLGLAFAALALASRRARKGFPPDRAPLMGVLGAFVFAGQMVNFPLPFLGTSGHLGGGVLLAILLGPAAATLVMAAILIVQCLIFQDGGLLALGCNIINMGLVPCTVGWALFRLLLGRGSTASSPPGGGRARAWRLYLAVWLASLAGLLAGAALVPVEAALSGVLQIPTGVFLSAMLALHVPIGAVEGLITFAVVAYIRRVSPGLVPQAAAAGVGQSGLNVRPGRSVVLASLLIACLATAGALAWLASSVPDGLETALTRRYVHADQPLRGPAPLMRQADQAQERTALLPDYSARQAPLGRAAEPSAEPAPVRAVWPNVSGWRSLAGVAGSLATLAVVYAVALGLRRRRNSNGEIRMAKQTRSPKPEAPGRPAG